MARVLFTPQLRRFVEVPEVTTSATTLRAALAEAFAGRERLAAYVLDEQGHLRPNVVVYVDGRRSADRVALADPVAADSTIHVLQALSGG